MADKKEQTLKGTTVLEPEVVATVARLAAQEVKGVHQIGGSSLIGRIMGKGESSKGIDVEVGERQAAFDISIILEYGAKVTEVADAIRATIVKRVKEMLDRDVVEVNVHIQGIHMPEEEKPLPEPKTPRVR